MRASWTCTSTLVTIAVVATLLSTAGGITARLPHPPRLLVQGSGSILSSAASSSSAPSSSPSSSLVSSSSSSSSSPPPPPSSTTETCGDSDGGAFPGIFGVLTVNYGLRQYADYCVSSNLLHEGNCQGTVTVKCPCKSGVCVGWGNGEYVEPPPFCTDSDGGNVPEVWGKTTENHGEHTDTCTYPDQLREYYCYGTIVRVAQVLCSCTSGQCERRTVQMSSASSSASVAGGDGISPIASGSVIHTDTDAPSIPQPTHASSAPAPPEERPLPPREYLSSGVTLPVMSEEVRALRDEIQTLKQTFQKSQEQLKKQEKILQTLKRKGASRAEIRSAQKKRRALQRNARRIAREGKSKVNKTKR